MARAKGYLAKATRLGVSLRSDVADAASVRRKQRILIFSKLLIRDPHIFDAKSCLKIGSNKGEYRKQVAMWKQGAMEPISL